MAIDCMMLLIRNGDCNHIFFITKRVYYFPTIFEHYFNGWGIVFMWKKSYTTITKAGIDEDCRKRTIYIMLMESMLDISLLACYNTNGKQAFHCERRCVFEKSS